MKPIVEPIVSPEERKDEILRSGGSALRCLSMAVPGPPSGRFRRTVRLTIGLDECMIQIVWASHQGDELHRVDANESATLLASSKAEMSIE